MKPTMRRNATRFMIKTAVLHFAARILIAYKECDEVRRTVDQICDGASDPGKEIFLVNAMDGEAEKFIDEWFEVPEEFRHETT